MAVERDAEQSHTSRSSQLAAGHTPLTVGTCAIVAGEPHLQPQPQPMLDRTRM